MVTVRFTFSRAENQRAMIYMALRSMPAIGMLALGAALLAGGPRRAVAFVPRRAFDSPAQESEFRDLLSRHIRAR